jgi:hypothetical protein
LKREAPPDFRRGFAVHSVGICYLMGRFVEGATMNTLERRQIVRGQIVDMAVAKTAINKSRRERDDAAKKLRKALAASRYAKLKVETISYPRSMG